MRVTFGIAVYNVGKYVGACIESVMAQAGNDVEIVIVDDGSTDGSGETCDRYAKLDARIRVIHQPNAGVSNARNHIIEAARGKWLCLIDGDDRLSPKAMEYINQYEDDSFDVIFFDMHTFVYDNKITKYMKKAQPTVIEGKGLEEFALSTMYGAKGTTDYINLNLRSVCAKMIRLDFLKKYQIRLKENLPISQDVIFNLDCLEYYNRIELVRIPFYYYRQNPVSTVRGYNPRVKENVTRFVHTMRDYVERHPYGGKMWERYFLRCAADMSTVIKLDFCHEKNPLALSERAQGFLSFLTLDWCAEALEKIQPEKLKDKERATFELYRRGDFSKVISYFEKKQKKEKMKVWLNRTGLNQLLRPLRDWSRGRA